MCQTTTQRQPTGTRQVTAGQPQAGAYERLCQVRPYTQRQALNSGRPQSCELITAEIVSPTSDFVPADMTLITADLAMNLNYAN